MLFCLFFVWVFWFVVLLCMGERIVSCLFCFDYSWDIFLLEIIENGFKSTEDLKKN